jgi:hypothetical protein
MNMCLPANMCAAFPVNQWPQLNIFLKSDFGSGLISPPITWRVVADINAIPTNAWVSATYEKFEEQLSEKRCTVSTYSNVDSLFTKRVNQA